MASHESFYTSGTPSSHPASPISSGPLQAPPPPPKPVAPYSSDPSRSGTPNLASTPITTAGPPLPPHPSQITSTTPNSPHALPPFSPTPQNQSNPNPNSPLAISTMGPPIPQAQFLHQNQYLQQQQQQQQQQPIPPPSFEEQWLPPNVASKPISELTPVLSNPQLIAALASQHPSHASSLEPLKAAIAANMALAKQVVQVEGQLTQLRDQTAQLLLHHTSLQTQWRRKQSEMDDALSPWGPRAMYQRLVSSINEQESLLKAMQESFLDGGGEDDGYYGGSGGKASEKEVTEWVRKIREGTTTLEKRREMRARWDEGRVGGWR